MIFGLLCGKHEGLSVVVHFDQLTVLSGNNMTRHAVLVLGEHRDLDQHGRDIVDALKGLKVD